MNRVTNEYIIPATCGLGLALAVLAAVVADVPGGNPFSRGRSQPALRAQDNGRLHSQNSREISEPAPAARNQISLSLKRRQAGRKNVAISRVQPATPAVLFRSPTKTRHQEQPQVAAIFPGLRPRASQPVQSSRGIGNGMSLLTISTLSRNTGASCSSGSCSTGLPNAILSTAFIRPTSRNKPVDSKGEFPGAYSRVPGSILPFNSLLADRGYGWSGNEKEDVHLSSVEIQQLDEMLVSTLERLQISKPDLSPRHSPEKVTLGKALFFDNILSGNRDISCAVCHHPEHHSCDDISLSIGTGGTHLGSHRELGKNGKYSARNAPDLFNRGGREWQSLCWDGRVSVTRHGTFKTPAGKSLPDGLDSVLAAQAMLPVVARDEMRGQRGDRDIRGEVNELARFRDGDFTGVWNALMKRLLDVPDYVRLFAAAYPNVPARTLGFQHAANAIAAFISDKLICVDSPWDRFLDGDSQAISNRAKQGALLFYGKARCVLCHSGDQMTDQAFYNLGVPQIGPGLGKAAPQDIGYAAVTGRKSDQFAFRTPPLRNVELTGPWMHNGSITYLEDAVRHHIVPARSLLRYDRSQLVPALKSTYQSRPAVHVELLRNLSPVLREIPALTDSEIDRLLAFLVSLTDSRALIQELSKLIPHSVPSGLKVHRH